MRSKILECPKCRSRLFRVEYEQLKYDMVCGKVYLVCADCGYKMKVNSNFFWK